MTQIVWKPQAPQDSRMWQFLRFIEQSHQQKFINYQQLHTWSVQYPALFWPSLIEFLDIRFDVPPTEIINQHKHMIDARWFGGAKFNYAEKLLNRDDEHLALICLNEHNDRQVLTHRELKNQIARVAMGLKNAGITQGDRVAAILPNSAYAIIAFLACASIGAIWSSCSPDFGVPAAVDRLGQIEPKLLFVTDSHQYNGKIHDFMNKAFEISRLIPSLRQIVVCPLQSVDKNAKTFKNMLYWDNFCKDAVELLFTALPFSHPLYILFSSGTTGKPKCIVHSSGGVLLQHLKELALHTDLNQNDNLFFYTTCGWMMWNWMISALALGATLTLYEGSPTYPKEAQLFRLIHQEKVSVFGTSAKYLSTVEKLKVRPIKDYSMESLRTILSTGSPLLPNNYDFVRKNVKNSVQLSSISGGTDIVSCFALGNPLLPVYRGELQCLGLGMSVEVFNPQGESVKNQRGELVCTKAFPSMPLGFWNDENNERYHNAYFSRFPNVWAHGDFAEITPHNGLIIHGRSDAVLNPGGVRIGTAEIYRQVEKIEAILDSVVIAQDWEGDVRIVLFVKLRDSLILNEALKATIKNTIRAHTTPRHVPAKIIQVNDIPHTINGKVVELAVRQMVHGEPINNLQSLANPKALDLFANLAELKQ